eukprot:6459945-Prymnesium_polylepis.1
MIGCSSGRASTAKSKRRIRSRSSGTQRGASASCSRTRTVLLLPNSRSTSRSFGVSQSSTLKCATRTRRWIGISSASLPRMRRSVAGRVAECAQAASHLRSLTCALAWRAPQAWEDAARRESDSWTVILEQDAHFVPVVNSTWYDLTKQILAQVRVYSSPLPLLSELTAAPRSRARHLLTRTSFG